MENELHKIIQQAFDEDIGSGDITTRSTVPADARGKAVIFAKQDAVISGLQMAETVFHLLDENIVFVGKIRDGDAVSSGQTIAAINGKLSTILTGERTALNFLGRMSGISTLTAAYVAQTEGTKAKILDTRKTTPNLRQIEKYAVKKGGAVNHRMGLYDSVLIKENHIRAAGGIISAIQAARKYVLQHNITCELEVEVQTLTELRQVLEVKVTRVLLDNMPIPTLKEAVEITQNKVPLEASGGVTLENVRDIAETGVDYISIGALTHSAKCVDLSLLVQEVDNIS